MSNLLATCQYFVSRKVGRFKQHACSPWSWFFGHKSAHILHSLYLQQLFTYSCFSSLWSKGSQAMCHLSQSSDSTHCSHVHPLITLLVPLDRKCLPEFRNRSTDSLLSCNLRKDMSHWPLFPQYLQLLPEIPFCPKGSEAADVC